MMEKETEDKVYAIVRNIPEKYHSKNLRSFFFDFVENDRFQCFHFRHRPEIQLIKDVEKTQLSKVSCCCVISFGNKEDRGEFIEEYHKKFWTDFKGREVPLRCFIYPIKLDEITKPSTSETETLSTADSRILLELRPPTLMPKGNVGTPSKYFLQQITACKLPPSVIAKLGLKPRKRLGKYCAVGMDYPVAKDSQEWAKKSRTVADSQQLYCYSRMGCVQTRTEAEDDAGKEFDDESVASDKEDNDERSEEWERHESLHDDVTEQERTKPRKYEEEQEVTWEKGGPGIVWYTDTFYWNEREEGTDSDWKWADDWDVDYSIYYDRKGGDLDAKQAVEILEDEKLRSGKFVGTVFGNKSTAQSLRYRRCSSSNEPREVGPFEFEKHTKGVGSKIMRRFGWQPGSGLGSDNSGRSVPLSADVDESEAAERSVKKTGLGYRGEKLKRTGFDKSLTSKKFGEATDNEMYESCESDILRREEPTHMKYR